MQTTQKNDDVLELEQVQKMEEQVNQISERIAEYRAKIPGQLKTALCTILASQRPALVTRFNEGSESQFRDPSSSDVGGPTESDNIVMVNGEEQTEAEKVQLLKQKISENASALPAVLNRMKDCMARIDKLQSCNGVIRPAFKRKRTS